MNIDYWRVRLGFGVANLNIYKTDKLVITTSAHLATRSRNSERATVNILNVLLSMPCAASYLTLHPTCRTVIGSASAHPSPPASVR